MDEGPKLLLIVGLALVAISALWFVSSYFKLPLFRLPGDIIVEKPNFKFYFPITTMILLSIILSLVFYVARYFKQ